VSNDSAPTNWTAWLKRVLDIDFSQYPNCGARLRVIDEVTEPNVIPHIPEQVKAREPELDSACRLLIHYGGKRAIRAFEIHILATGIANASDVRHDFEARSARIGDILVCRSASTIPIPI
jgi:hypothetical protein